MTEGSASVDCRAIEENDTVVAYVAGRLEEAEAEAFERHVMECDRCAAELSQTVGLRAALRPAQSERPQRPARWSGLAIAAAVALVAVGLGLLSLPLLRRPTSGEAQVLRGPA